MGPDLLFVSLFNMLSRGQTWLIIADISTDISAKFCGCGMWICAMFWYDIAQTFQCVELQSL